MQLKIASWEVELKDVTSKRLSDVFRRLILLYDCFNVLSIYNSSLTPFDLTVIKNEHEVTT